MFSVCFVLFPRPAVNLLSIFVFALNHFSYFEVYFSCFFDSFTHLMFKVLSCLMFYGFSCSVTDGVTFCRFWILNFSSACFPSFESLFKFCIIFSFPAVVFFPSMFLFPPVVFLFEL